MAGVLVSQRAKLVFAPQRPERFVIDAENTDDTAGDPLSAALPRLRAPLPGEIVVEASAVCVGRQATGPVCQSAVTRSRDSRRCDRPASPAIAEKSPACSRPPPLITLSSYVARPSICQVGRKRLGNATDVRPNVPRISRAHPIERSR